MAFQIDARLVSPDTATEGGGPYVSLFLFMLSPSSYGRKRDREGHQYSKFEQLDTVNESVAISRKNLPY